jgi:NAD(P)-dependent dehydrogenase (short-subunit alcohol dehydrogenase family)
MPPRAACGRRTVVMNDNNSERVAVVTGAALGIGRAYARRLSADGARVVLADIADTTETEGLIRSDGGDPVGVRCDVSSPDDVSALAKAAEAIGGADILVHNAGIYPMTPFADVTFEEWKRVIAVNLDSLFLLAQAFVPGMCAKGWGRIVGISSGTFHLGAGSPVGIHYVASKGGVIGFIRSLAADVGQHGVTVNAIAPGLVHSHGTDNAHADLDMFDVLANAQAIKRNGQPEDLTGAMAYLVSDEGSFITGQTLLVDGGMNRA